MSASLSRRGARWLVGALLVSHVGAGVKGIMGLACLSDGRCAMTNDNTSALCVLSRGAPSSTTNEGLAARMIWNGTGDDQIHGVTFINASHLAVALQARDLIAVVSARGGGLAATYELAPGSGPIYVARAAAFSIAVTLKDAGSAALVDVGGGAPSGAAAQQLTADGVIPDAHGVYATADSACLLVTYREAGRGGVWELCAGRGYEELGSWPGLNLHQIVPLPGPASNDTFVLLDRSAGALYLWSRAAPSELALVAGSNTTTGFCDGVGADARFDSPHALSLYDDHSVSARGRERQVASARFPSPILPDLSKMRSAPPRYRAGPRRRHGQLRRAARVRPRRRRARLRHRDHRRRLHQRRPLRRRLGRAALAVPTVRRRRLAGRAAAARFGSRANSARRPVAVLGHLALLLGGRGRRRGAAARAVLAQATDPRVHGPPGWLDVQQTHIP